MWVADGLQEYRSGRIYPSLEAILAADCQGRQEGGTAPFCHLQQPEEFPSSFRDLNSGQTRIYGFDKAENLRTSQYETELVFILKIFNIGLPMRVSQ